MGWFVAHPVPVAYTPICNWVFEVLPYNEPVGTAFVLVIRDVDAHPMLADKVSWVLLAW